MNIMQMIRTSEFWLGAAVVLGQILVSLGVVPQEQWNNVLYPALVYIVGRVTSKAVKAVPTKEEPK